MDDKIGAAVKSPLIMGNDLRTIIPADLAILSNAAVIAVSQDPLGSSAARRWLKASNTSALPGTTAGALQMWSGNLVSTTGGTYNDMVVLLINGAEENMTMEATLSDIFVDSGPKGTAKQNKISWEVRDLWANRMSIDEAQSIIDAAHGNGTTIGNGTVVADRYNATQTSYKDGLKSNNTLLLGSVVSTVQPSGTVTANVEAHGAVLYRLRAVPTAVVQAREL